MPPITFEIIDGRKTYNCPFCSFSAYQMRRHLISMHKNHPGLKVYYINHWNFWELCAQNSRLTRFACIWSGLTYFKECSFIYIYIYYRLRLIHSLSYRVPGAACQVRTTSQGNQTYKSALFVQMGTDI